MNFSTKTTEHEFFSSLEKEMKKAASFEESLEDNRLNSVLALLIEAQKQLSSVGLRKEAQQVAVIHKVVQDDKNPEHYIQNLLQHGMMQDLDCSNDSHNADTCQTADCGICSEGEQPQLSQDELSRLRSLLKTEDKEHAAVKPKEESKKESTEKSEKDDDDDKNDATVTKKTPSGDLTIEMNEQETKNVLSYRKSLLKELTKLL